MKNKALTVVTQEDLTKFAESCFKGIKQFDGYLIEYDKKLFSFTLKLKGEKYNSSITTPVLESLLSIQKGIYALYKQYAFRRPSREDKKRLELVVRVEKGSSEIVFSLLEQLGVIKEAVQKMTGDQTFAAIIVGISTFGLVTLSKRIFDHLEKKHAQDIELQKVNVNTDKDKQMIESFSKTVATVANLRKNVMADLGGIEDAVLTYSGEDIPLSELKERITADRKRKELEISTINSSYRITRLHFNFEDNSAKADMYDTKNDEVLSSVEIQPRSIIDGTFAVLKKAQDKKNVDLQVIIQKKDNKIVKATLDKVL